MKIWVKIWEIPKKGEVIKIGFGNLEKTKRKLKIIGFENNLNEHIWKNRDGILRILKKIYRNSILNSEIK